MGWFPSEIVCDEETLEGELQTEEGNLPVPASAARSAGPVPTDSQTVCSGVPAESDACIFRILSGFHSRFDPVKLDGRASFDLAACGAPLSSSGTGETLLPSFALAFAIFHVKSGSASDPLDDIVHEGRRPTIHPGTSTFEEIIDFLQPGTSTFEEIIDFEYVRSCSLGNFKTLQNMFIHNLKDLKAAKKLRIKDLKGGAVVDVGTIWSNLNRLAKLIRISLPSPALDVRWPWD